MDDVYRLRAKSLKDLKIAIDTLIDIDEAFNNGSNLITEKSYEADKNSNLAIHFREKCHSAGAERRCSQSGVLLLLLWKILVDDLLDEPTGKFIHGLGYVDDVVTIGKEMFASMVLERAQETPQMFRPLS